MPPRYEPPWVGRVPAARRPSFPVLREDRSDAVVIVGAGLTGCATAYACASAGLKPVVLEAGRLASAGTAAGAGLILPWPEVAFRDVVAASGLRVGKAAFKSWRRASLDAATLLKRLAVRCDLTPVDVLSIAGAGEGERLLKREFDARVDAGLDLRWLTERQARAAILGDGGAGMRQSGAFGFDPYRASLGLAMAAAKKGATFFEGTPVTRIRHARAHVDVVTAKGTIKAQNVVVATGEPGALFASLRRHFTPHDTYHVLTEELPAAIRRQVVGAGLVLEDTRSPHWLARLTPDNRFLVAGASQRAAKKTARERLLRHWTFELMYELLKQYPSISGTQPVNGWTEVQAVTRDGLPYIGLHRNYPRHLFAWGGAAGGSSTGAFLAARLLVRALTDTTETADAAFGFTR